MSVRRCWARPSRAGPSLIFVVAGSLAACSEPLPSDQRTFSDLTDFVGGYWERPIPLQGAPPDSFNPLEASFEPETCGTCHPQQFADWGTTVHAGAYSPGLAGQLVNMANYASVRSCLACHTPLSEQHALVPDGEGQLVDNPYFDRSLQKRGLICAGCHFRGWRKYGPPRRDGSLDPSPPGSPHGGVNRTPYFEDSRFCANCHQFDAPAANGKSLQNTYVEWKNSKYAAMDVHCQSCHMPDRKHLWRGIHDSTMVAGGVSIRMEQMPGDGQAVLRVKNTGVGHRFPTYVTPEVQVRIRFLDYDGQPMEGSGGLGVIGRRVQNPGTGWQELSDTRLRPDSTFTVDATPPPGARFAVGTVVVLPDRFYEGVFAGMLSRSLSDTSRALIAEAHRRASNSSFTIYADTMPVR